MLFRVDASVRIGTGHVMRCLTLAGALQERGADCRFICRNHPGHLIEEIKQRGFVVTVLPFNSSWPGIDTPYPAHADWLGEDWDTDVNQTRIAAGETAVDWLIIDHYAIEARWERSLTSHCKKLMVIDDLADRFHSCNLLLDQNFGRDITDYISLVPNYCRLLCGSYYALLGPEFSALRPYSLQRRTAPALRDLLITMGGVDKDNATGQVLHALCSCPLPPDCRITVVMGARALWLDEVRKMAKNIPWSTNVLVGVNNMAQLMADSDLAIGAAGATAWERCCLGVPTIMLVLAENQRKIARALSDAGAGRLLELSNLKSQLLITPDYLGPVSLGEMSRVAAMITDGVGAKHVTQILMSEVEHAG